MTVGRLPQQHEKLRAASHHFHHISMSLPYLCLTELQATDTICSVERVNGKRNRAGYTYAKAAFLLYLQAFFINAQAGDETQLLQFLNSVQKY